MSSKYKLHCKQKLVAEKQEVVQKQTAQSPCCSPQMFPVPLALLHQLSLHVHVMTALSQDARATLLRHRQSTVCHIWLDMSWIEVKHHESYLFVHFIRVGQRPQNPWEAGVNVEITVGVMSLWLPQLRLTSLFKKTQIRNHTDWYWFEPKFHF